MSLGIGIGIGVDRGGGGGTEAAIRAMFANSEQGAWFDPSDLSSMFQTGTGTPVTAVEQPVGLILDKRLGRSASTYKAVTSSATSGFTTPDAAASSFTGSFDFDFHAAADDWTPAATQFVVGKDVAGNRSYAFGIASTGALYIEIYGVGDIPKLLTSSVVPTVLDGAALWCRIKVIWSTTVNITADFYTSADGVAWTALGTQQSVATAGVAIHDSNQPLYVGRRQYTGGEEKPFVGKIYRVRLYSGDRGSGGTLAVDFNPLLYASGSTFVGGTGETWTLESTARIVPDGNHATQATSAARPTLSARANLLTRTEAWDHGDWTAALASTVTANAGADPLGGSTAERLEIPTGTGNGRHQLYVTTDGASKTYTASVYVKSNTGSSQDFRIKCTHAAVLDQFSPDKTATTSWQRFDYTVTNGASAGTGQFMGVVNGTSEAPLDLLVWGAQLELASAATRYQRVTASGDYDTAGFPHYLKTDGVDDSMTTAAIDFSATDKMTVWAGVRKLSDATQGMIFELNSAAAAGTFFLVAPDTVAATDYRAQLQGASGTAKVVSAAAAAPITNVLAAQYDIAAAALSEVVLRLNGVAGGTASGNATTGNFGNYALHMFRRGGATLPFNGHFYGGIVRGAASTAAQLSTVERYLAAKSGVTL